MPRTDPQHPAHPTGPNLWHQAARHLTQSLRSSPSEKMDWCACLPVCGYDRNQPLRRILSALECGDSPVHQDPAVIYHFDEQIVPRRSSVEMWIEACGMIFSENDVRDFWENIWNMAVKAWDYIDLAGQMPWQSPYPGFPLLTPAFWKGSRRSRFLFQPFPRFLESMKVHPGSAFQNWLETLLRFQYGMNPACLTLGMAALALNAPSEAYHPGETLQVLQSVCAMTYPEASSSASPLWRVEASIRFDPERFSSPVHQFFWSDGIQDLFAQCAFLTIGSSGKGWIYLRGDLDSPEKQKQTGHLVLEKLFKGLPIEDPSGAEILQWERIGEGCGPFLGPVMHLSGIRQSEPMI